VSARYPLQQVRDEARAEFEATVIPDDFDVIELPLPERGEPVHRRAS
jgi:ribonuclease Z